jgi:hypothetical protein
MRAYRGNGQNIGADATGTAGIGGIEHQNASNDGFFLAFEVVFRRV